MSEWLRWWLVLEAAGAAALPLCLLVFARLPDRGFSLARPFALILLGYLFWLLNSLGILPNTPGGIRTTLLLVLAMSAAAAWHRREELREWLERNWRYAVCVEIAFFLLFAFAVWLRTLVGQISGTEQPMDLMFVNAATQAENFPPKDPWLSGFDVAYYYFGYLIVAMTGKLAAVPTEMGYNLGLGMIAALTLTGGFGIVYNLVRLRDDVGQPEAAPVVAEPEPKLVRRPRRSDAVAAAITDERGELQLQRIATYNWRPVAFGAAGAVLLVVMGNLVWFLQHLSSLGFGSQGFYDALNISGLDADEGRANWYPSDFFNFFNVSRVYPLSDRDYVITEFPMFSFILGDLHPHVMALPFVLLVVALALTLYRSAEPLDVAFWMRRPALLAGSAVLIGALAFLNTWDIATMAFVVVAAALIANYASARAALAVAPAGGAEPVARGLDARRLSVLAIVGAVHIGLAVLIVTTLTPAPLIAFALVGVNVAWVALLAWYLAEGGRWPLPFEALVRTASFAIPLIMLAVVAYIPFYRSFESQASGIFPVVTQGPITEPGTRLDRYLIFWLPLLIVVLPLVGWRLYAWRDRITRREALIAAAVPAAVIIGWVLLFGFHKARDAEQIAGASGLFTQIGDRGGAWLTAIVVGGLLAGALLALWLEATARDADPASGEERRPLLFALLLASTGLLLSFGTEFFYVDDVFDSRMNTVFKLYYQAWLLLALAGGFALYYLAASWRSGSQRERRVRIGWAVAAALVLAAALLYPLSGTMNRIRWYEEVQVLDANGQPVQNDDGTPKLRWEKREEQNRGLDGISRFPPDELAAIDWLKGVGRGQDVVLAEAFCASTNCSGNDYTEAARISAATGVPVILGWAGHEDQWRGGSAEARAGRFEDVQSLYNTDDMGEVARIVEQYGVTYIYVGPLERRVYGTGVDKFGALPVAFQAGEVTVYQAQAALTLAEAAP